MTIRVLVVDDSAFMRRVVSEAIAAEPDMEVAGTAVNGLDALLKVERVQPDVVTLDVEMPEMDGLTALRHLMARYPRPVVMVSSLTQAGAVTTIRALTIGAVDFVAKPSGSISLDFHRVRDELVQKVRVAATAKVRAPRSAAAAVSPPPLRPIAAQPKAWDQLVVLGTSTGGPRALATVVPELPVDGSTAYLVVQHMPAGFTRSLAERLDGLTHLTVREAAAGDRLGADTVLVAPGDYHVRVNADGELRLDQGPRVHGVRPSVDVALESIAAAFGARTITAILTGMGQDGAAGAAAVRAAGGLVIAEDETTCVVWGMPRAVLERGGADSVVPIQQVAPSIARALLQQGAARLAGERPELAMVLADQTAITPDFEAFRKRACSITGLDLTSYKAPQMQRRLSALLARVQVASFAEYAGLLERDSRRRQEFLDYVTINVSEFFRDADRFGELEKRILPELLSAAGSRGLNVWSAGCSIGAEPYSIAILLRELGPGRHHQVLATDVDQTILARAQAGAKYALGDVRNVGAERLARWFSADADGTYAVGPAPRALVTFEQHDLLRDAYPAGPFDLIACRNVVIYFTDLAKERIYAGFADALRPGGVLFVGGTEAILRPQALNLQVLGPGVYGKVARA